MKPKDFWTERNKSEKEYRKACGPLFDILKIKEEYYEDDKKQKLSKNYAEVVAKIYFSVDNEKQLRELRKRCKQFVEGFSKHSDWEEKWEADWEELKDE